MLSILFAFKMFLEHMSGTDDSGVRIGKVWLNRLACIRKDLRKCHTELILGSGSRV